MSELRYALAVALCVCVPAERRSKSIHWSADGYINGADRHLHCQRFGFAIERVALAMLRTTFLSCKRTQHVTGHRWKCAPQTSHRYIVTLARRSCFPRSSSSSGSIDDKDCEDQHRRDHCTCPIVAIAAHSNTEAHTLSRHLRVGLVVGKSIESQRVRRRVRRLIVARCEIGVRLLPVRASLVTSL